MLIKSLSRMKSQGAFVPVPESIVHALGAESVACLDVHLIQSPIFTPNVHPVKQSPGESSALL